VVVAVRVLAPVSGMAKSAYSTVPCTGSVVVHNPVRILKGDTADVLVPICCMLESRVVLLMHQRQQTGQIGRCSAFECLTVLQQLQGGFLQVHGIPEERRNNGILVLCRLCNVQHCNGDLVSQRHAFLASTRF
jgi:hypothetical protein